MNDNRDRRDIEDDQDFTEGLYHEAQADGVPYEDLEPFTKDLPKLDYPRH